MGRGLSVLVALALSSHASADIFTKDHHAQKKLWDSFKKDFGKSYSDVQEEAYRFEIFLDTLKLIDERNKKETGSAVHGITKFADLSVEEFKKFFLTNKPSQSSGMNIKKFAVEDEDDQLFFDTDWTGIYTTPVKDQGYCGGGSWAFTSTEQIESDYWRGYGIGYELSTQQMLSCALPGQAGCGGGFYSIPQSGYAYSIDAGLELDSDYPDTSSSDGVTGYCRANSSKFVVKSTDMYYVSGISGYGSIDETNMMYYVASAGPVSALVDASEWSTYVSGVLSTCDTSVNYAVQAVGVYTKSDAYWKVRNSWGVNWGEKGFIRLSYGNNTCGIATDAMFVDAVDY